MLLGTRYWVNLTFLWFQPNADTRKLVVEEGFKYDSDSYADDLPYWSMEYDRPHLVIPYTLTENDMKLVAPNNFAHGTDFFTHLKSSLLYLIEEGKQGSPKMMSVGLHCRLARPGMAAGLAEFMDFCLAHKRDVWICTREQIADHWFKHHPPRAAGPPGIPTSPISPHNEARDTWTGPKTVPKVVEPEESEVDEADGDII
jgi:peptidoglycan/xylan/chitin deacetylase (PgdA/CDA1 family)